MHTLARLNSLLAAVLFAGLTFVVSLQVISRFVLHIPIIWSEELARFLFFWVVMLGAAQSVRTRRHFVIDVGLRARVFGGRTGKLLFDIIPDVCVLLFSIFLAVQGIGYARAGVFRTATNSGINMAIVYAAIPLFAALCVIYSATTLMHDVVAFRQGQGAQPLPPQDAE